MSSSRFRPSVDLQVGSTHVPSKLATFHGYSYCTNRTGTFDMEIANQGEQFSGVFQHADPVIATIQGAVVWKGRLEQPDDDVEKPHGYTIKLSGRDDGAALQDVVTSKNYASSPSPTADLNYIITDILSTYNSSKKSKDPTINVGNIPAAGVFSFQVPLLFKRYDLWRMLQEVADNLGAPIAVGGLNDFYDFWVDAADNFYFVQVGTLPSSGIVNLGNIGNIEIKKRTYTIDGLPIKNDIWVWGPQNAGTIPLTMQLGYTGYPTDSWTEGNAADYAGSILHPPYPSTQAAILLDDSVSSPIPHPTGGYAVGSKCIRAQVGGTAPAAVKRAGWPMPFPFGSGKWPAQAPGGHLNAYNEISPMAETMGEMTAFHYYIQSTFNTTHWLEVADQGGTGNVMQSPGFQFGGQNLPLNQWNDLNMPFGPSANYGLVNNGGTPFDWSNIQQVNFIFDISALTLSAPGYIWFDGFRIVKPLVVNTNDATATTNRTHVVDMPHLLNYPTCKLYANSLLENMRTPQQYYLITRVGNAVDNFKVGYQIASESVPGNLVLREVEQVISKGEWTQIGKAWQKT